MDQLRKHSGIIIMNLGTPESTRVPDVKAYLDEFLMDEKVMDYPYLFRWLLVRKLITPRRAPKSAEAYKTVWGPEGSPLMVISEKVQKALEEASGFPVSLAMRYGKPTPPSAFQNLLKRDPNLEEVILIPLYPHYAMASYETAYDNVLKAYREGSYSFKLKVVRPFYKEPDYIEALANSIRPYLKSAGDYLLFSFHGVPVRHIKKGDITGHHCLAQPDCCTANSPAHSFCYRHQVTATAHLAAKALGLSKKQYGISFQSRLGRAEWLQPYTVETLAQLPGRGVKNLVVVCPAFTTDCLETLEEIAIEGKETFLKSGGVSYETIPSLNDKPEWIALLNKWAHQIMEGDHTMNFEGKKEEISMAPPLSPAI